MTVATAPETDTSFLHELGIEPVNSGAFDGSWLETGGELLESLNPTTGEPIAAVRQASAEDYERVAAASVEAIHSAVALPVDEILNDAVHVMERYIGHEPEVVERLQRILRNARDIKQVIQKVGQRLAPAQALPHPPEVSRPALDGRRVLLVDEDTGVREAAHA